MDISSRKKNLSFSFNVDLDDVVDNDSKSSTDSEAVLQIDTTEMDILENNASKKRESLGDTAFVKKKEEELERQLDEKAAKTNLTATNVKNIIKHVISHELVKAMVQKSPTMGDIIFEPKLTRSKAKELGVSHPDILGPLTPVKHTNTSEVQVLIEGEFSENSSDEEYDPDKDLQDDDKEVECTGSTGSDIDSQPSTPATPDDPSFNLEDLQLLEVQYDEEGVFKIPQIPHAPTKEESIGHRTRSKLNLKETPLEEIEQAFVPPDITSDMYECDWEPDEDWAQFLQSCYQKEETGPQEVNINEDDPEDPEYNILEDKELDFLDKEELRHDKAVKIPKHELKDLIAQLGEHGDKSVRDEKTREQEEQLQLQKLTKKKKIDTCTASPTNNFINMNPMVDLITVLAEPELPKYIDINVQQLLSVQMSQHVQLLAQQILMTYKHPKLHYISKVCKDLLNSLSTLGTNDNSKFLAGNFFDALQLISDWESKLDDPVFSNEYVEGLETEEKKEILYFENSQKYIPNFHPELIKLMAESKALQHPQMLPEVFPRTVTGSNKTIRYLPSEENLIAIGLEQFISYYKSSKKQFRKDIDFLNDAVRDIQKYLIPVRSMSALMYYIKKRKWSKKDNIIKDYFVHGTVPKVEHQVLPLYPRLAPIDQPIEVLPNNWKKFILSMKKNDLDEFLKFPKSPQKNMKKTDSSVMSLNVADANHDLRNPMVYMFHMPSLMTPDKSIVSNVSIQNTNENENSETLEQNVITIEPEIKVEPCISTSKTTPKKCSSIAESKINMKTRAAQLKANETKSDAESAKSQRAGETDEEKTRPTRLRMTTPRLAKIKSAQNMKLLAQAMSSRTSVSSCNVEENKEDNKNEDSEDLLSVDKGDNEDEIAELMLASTTIKKNTTNRKKTKQAREQENLKRLIDAQRNIDENERAHRFASSYLQRVHERLESQDPELSKMIAKSFVEFEKNMQKACQPECTDDCAEVAESPCNSKKSEKDILTIEFYKDICENLKDHPDLCSEFVLFLKPHQAVMINKAAEYLMLMTVSDFFLITQNYFSKQPSRIAKIMQALTQMASDPHINVGTLLNTTNSVFKGHPMIIDMFLHLFPKLKPPESLFAPGSFENLVCPSGPSHDKQKEFDEDAPELYESIDLPVLSIQEDPYGGDSCKCDCHAGNDETKSKGTNEHCAACGTRFLNGRVYLQTPEGLRPAKITFPGAEEEKLENISRVSLKTTKRIPSPPPKKRRKYSKRDSISEEPDGAKAGLSKVSPAKDNEEKVKSKKTSKSPLKSATKVQTAIVKCKRDKKSDKKDEKTKQTTDDDQGEPTYVEQKEFDEVNCKIEETSTDSHEDDNLTSPEKRSLPGREKTEISSDSDSHTEAEIDINKSWTLEDDRTLLEQIQKDYSEKTFNLVSLLLKRPVEQVKERFEFLLLLLEQMS
ncbi:uncharacterized protein LOC106646780 [Copidosoma floridanum]|uniref:uncharacterized protein LOC106646780 n=1 Tax=Copidosoma floridanum TaxID=29053 RepID=UPI0006C94DE2|nr:uncharacterized protein LOC106646780 [Copidosoma floridanum]